MANILFYSPFNQRSLDTESLMLAFHKQGHHVVSLTQQEGYLINDFLKSKGIEAHSYVLTARHNGWWYYLQHLIFFIRFCWNHRINVVYSHLEPSNFVASIGQYLIKAHVFLCRHHIDEGLLYGFDKSFSYKITYKLAKKVLVVSEHARKYMIETERIPKRKITHINLAYDFSLFSEPNPNKTRQIRAQFPAEILLVSACRLTKFKRPDLAVRTLKELIDIGLDAKLVLLGQGEMYDILIKLINELNLGDHVSMPGFVNNVLDYMYAADFLVHPSLLDSSCVVVKEAGLVSKPVIVCRGIGDFSDYIRHGKNGFTVRQEKFVEDAVAIISKNYKDSEYLKKIGTTLELDVRKLFSVENVVPHYSRLNGSV